jgi:CheY-like chemotaxis protein
MTGLRILVVDDNEVNREVTTMTLERDHVITTATNGIEALVNLAFGRFDLVLMDVQMPVLDGLSTTTLIRTIEAGKPLSVNLPQHVEQILYQKLGGGHLPVVAMTAHAMGGDEDICLSSGMDAYIAKPFDAARLNEVLGTVNRKTPSKNRAASPSEEKTAATVETSQPPPATPEEVLTYLRTSTTLTLEQSEKILAAARQSVTTLLAAAEKAQAEDDRTTLAKAAHTLKGTLAQCGLDSWAAMAQELYSGIHHHQEVPNDDLLRQLKIGLRDLLNQD